MGGKGELRKASWAVGVLACVLALALAVMPAWADSSSTSTSSSSSSDAASSTIAGDSAGTVFSQQSPLQQTTVAGDLYWAGGTLTARQLHVGNDLMAVGGTVSLDQATVDGDVRLAGQRLSVNNVSMQGNGTFFADSLSIGKGTHAEGLYCGANAIDFQGTATYLTAYGNSIYFNGTVDGNVDLSAQDIVIGPDAKITGTLHVRSGQNVAIPASASVARVDNTLDNPNAIDQVTELRAAIAPYFQVGSILFLIVSAVLVALLLLWLNYRHLKESVRVLHAHPFGHLLLGFLGTLGMAAGAVLCFVLVFTIPAGIALLLVLLACLIVCVPFTGASLALSLKAGPRPARAALGAAVGAGLLFVPYLGIVVLVLSLIHMVGYVLRCLFMGHDQQFNDEIGRRRAKPQHALASEETESPESESAEDGEQADEASAAPTSESTDEPLPKDASGR